jgi:hypothetical protein
VRIIPLSGFKNKNKKAKIKNCNMYSHHYLQKARLHDPKVFIDETTNGNEII